MSEDKKAEAATATEPHPLTPLENQLNGSTHNASAAVKAIIDYFEKEIAKLRAEFSPAKDEGKRK